VNTALFTLSCLDYYTASGVFTHIFVAERKMAYAIVEFTSKETGIICSSWFVNEEEDSCYWPAVASTRMKSLLIKMVTPDRDSSLWQEYSVRVLGKAG